MVFLLAQRGSGLGGKGKGDQRNTLHHCVLYVHNECSTRMTTTLKLILMLSGILSVS